MVSLSKSALFRALLLVTSCCAFTALGAVDGPYQSPVPGPGNDALEVWWFQATAPAVNNIVPSIVVTFTLGSVFTRAPTDPSYSIAVIGNFPNGTVFSITAPVSTLPRITTNCQAVTGEFGDIGTFSVTPNAQSFDFSITITDDAYGLNGSIHSIALSTPAHFGCGVDISGCPSFETAAVPDVMPNTPEYTLEHSLGWLYSTPRAVGSVDISIQGSPLRFLSAFGFHDHVFSPLALDSFVDNWFSGQGPCGPYDLSYAHIQALNSTSERSIVDGYLAFNGRPLIASCETPGEEKYGKVVTVTPTGKVSDASGITLPTGFTIDYVLGAKHYQFRLETSVLNVDVPIYHRWTLSGEGGLVGGQQYQCALVGEYINPGQVSYP